MDVLLSLPPASAASFAELFPESGWFATHDPVGRRLGSAGGTAHVLAEAWGASGTPSFIDWLRAGPRIIIHSGGHSRRLPAYAALGKALMPIPVLPGRSGQSLDQRLIDLQLPFLRRALSQAPQAAILVFGGDALLDPTGPLDRLPDVDVVGLGTRVPAEQARHHGLFFRAHSSPDELAYMLQKPSLDEIERRSATHDFLHDSGAWLLSGAAVMAIMGRCGWDADRQRFEGGEPAEYDLYGDFGLLLGAAPTMSDPRVPALTSAAVEVPARYRHFGTNRQMIEAVAEMSGASGSNRWVDNSVLDGSARLAGENIVTGVPAGLALGDVPEGICVDVVELSDGKYALRTYHVDDRFSSGDRMWMHRPIELDGDLQFAPLFPVFADLETGSRLLRWMVHREGDAREYENAERLSADELGRMANLLVMETRRRSGHHGEAVRRLEAGNYEGLDLGRLATLIVDQPVRDGAYPWQAPILRANVHRLRGLPYETDENEAFAALAEQILDECAARPCTPRAAVQPDQMVTVQAPVRLDLAGGKTDTPPYCNVHGGMVVNLAVTLDGIRPLQVFLRPISEPVIELRSIDGGQSARITDYAEIASCRNPQSDFALAKAALAVSGFLPRFGASASTLADHLKECGGIEITILSGVPHGSGLGTSSILAAALLAGLNDFYGLGWSGEEVCQRTLALEQLLTTGGGWQDQVGGVFGGVKSIATSPGIRQDPLIEALPGDLFKDERILLYYTGLTRMAKGIMRNVIRGVMEGRHETLETISGIRENADRTAAAVRSGSFDALADAVAERWELMKAVDEGTNPPALASMIDTISPHVRGLKLLGAGGGGYLLVFARDASAADAIRAILPRCSPATARFVRFEVDPIGLVIARS